MIRGIFKSYSAWQKLLVALFVTILILTIASSLSYVFALYSNTHLSYKNILLISQFAQCLMIFGGSALLLSYLFDYKPFVYLYTTKTKAKYCLYSVGAAIILFPIINIIAYYNNLIHLPEGLSKFELLLRQMEDAANNFTMLMLNGDSIINLVVGLIVVAATPAICEELFFRALVQRILLEFTSKKHIVLFISAFIFSFFHFQFFGFIPRFILGYILGYILIKTQSIWPGICFHFTNNAIAVICYWLANNNFITLPDGF